MHILSAGQFTISQIELIFARADFFKEQSKNLNHRRQLAHYHSARQICTIFYQPSTRTRLSFETAATKLGIGVISTENALEHSSAVKGESLEDTIKILNGYEYDMIVMRHNQAGAAKKAAKVSRIPIINAGDGKGEHPTQSLLDAYTIYKNLGRLDNLKVVMGGDLQYGRTVRSLAKLLSKYPSNHISFVSLPEFSVGRDVKRLLNSAGVKFSETASFAQAVKDADVIYWTRLQTEHLASSGNQSGGYILDTKALKSVPKNAIILHPMPRVDEIDKSVDTDPRAKYFEQAANGLYTRMALLDMILSGVL